MNLISRIASGAVKEWKAIQAEAESLWSHLTPSEQAAAQPAISALKQGASDVLGMAETAAGPAFVAGTAAVETAVDTGLAALHLSVLDVPADTAISKLADGLHAAVDAQIAAWRAKLAASAK